MQTAPMDAGVVDGFAEALRRGGLSLPTTTVLDLHRVASTVGMASKGDLRDALRAVVVRGGDDRFVFDQTFDAFFELRAATAEGEGTILDDATRARILAALAAQSLGELSAPMAAVMAGGDALESWLRAAASAAGLGTMGHGMQSGIFSHRVLRQAQLTDLANAEPALRRALDAALGDDTPRVMEVLMARRIAAERFVRALVATEFERRNPLRLARWRREHLLATDFRRLDAKDAARLAHEVSRLVTAMKGRLAVRRKHHRGRRLDVRATARAALRTAGVPFRPRFRRARPHAPDLLLVCDISESVRTVSRLFLSLVHALHDQTPRVRSFVFVGRLGEATDLFRTLPLDAAVAAAHQGAVVPTTAMTDYGAAFTDLVAHHGDAITRHTTVVVLGDARSNRTDPALTAFAQIAARAERVLWLNPESRPSWGTGDSVMGQYLPHVRETFVVHNLESLAKAVDRLVRPA